MGQIPSAVRRGNIHAEVRVAAQLCLGDSLEPAGTGESGSYLTINRMWQSGDTNEFTLPAEIRVKRYNGKDQIAGKSRYSFEYSPALLAVVEASTVDIPIYTSLKAEEIGGNLQPLPGQPLHFSIPGSPQYKLILCWQAPANEEFTCYPTITASS
jgi:hypothetical protein